MVYISVRRSRIKIRDKRDKKNKEGYNDINESNNERKIEIKSKFQNEDSTISVNVNERKVKIGFIEMREGVTVLQLPRL